MLNRIRALFNRKGRSTAIADRADAPPVHHGPQVVHRPIPIDDLDVDAVKILRRLTRFEHTAYLVGGCVRDLLLERVPKDYDIGTSATPRQIKRLFRNCRIIGRRFRLAHIYFQNGKIIEVATFRSRDAEDSSSGDGPAGDQDILIRDDNVFGTPEDDALRRDFSINQLFYDLNAESVIDHAGGLDDLRRRHVRAIGDAEIRFREDPIRILRAIKFAARLGFEIEPVTKKALVKCRNEIPKAAAPRILEEINRFCRGGEARRSFELLKELKVFEIILPEFADAYRGHRAEWNFLLELLSEIDRRHAEGREATTGSILAALILPVIVERMGWSKSGTAEPPRGVKMRDLADELLRPMSVRLRSAKKDQERCRQILMSLFRMVPARRIRANTRRAILRRECLPDTLWILDCAAARYKGDFPEAVAYWGKAASEEPELVGSDRAEEERSGRGARRGRRGGRRRRKPEDRPQTEQVEEQAAAAKTAGEGEAKPKRRRRRGGRGRKSGGGEGAAKPAAAAKKPDVSPWDDRYFFAALPSVPQLEGDEGAADRYGADTLKRAETAGDEAPAETAVGDEAGTESPAKPRRRRRRGGRGRRKKTTVDSATPGAEAEAAESGGDES